MFDGMAGAIDTLLSTQGLIALLAGTLIGLLVSVIPGVSGINAMALLLPVTFTMDSGPALVFLVAIMAAGGFAGSITSILLNVPGDPVNAATCLDGYPMARQGKAGVAIAASATASAIGAVFGLLLLSLSVPLLRNVILFFGPPELFAFAVAGISLIASVTGSSVRKGLIAGGFGMILGAIGYNEVTGAPRFTGGVLSLYDGIPQVAAIVGLFALPELYQLMRSRQSISRGGILVSGGVRTGMAEVFRRPGLVLRSSALGTILGIVPGVGGSVAGWMAYFSAQRASKDPQSFGKGNIEGVIAPDSALNSKEGASMMPLLALGVPGSLSTAILLSAFYVHGISPGQRLFQNDMSLIWALILAMVIVNVATSLLGLVAANQVVKLTLVPVHVLVPLVLVLTLLGSYVETQTFIAIVVAFGLGLLGIGMVRHGYPRSPLLVGFILFPLAEQSFFRSRQISRGSYDFLFRPITLTILVITLLALVSPILWRMWVVRRARKAGTTPVAEATTTGEEDEEQAPRSGLQEAAVSAGLLVVAGGFAVAAFAYSADARAFPLLVLVALVALSGWGVLRGLAQWRTERFTAEPEPEPEPRPRGEWASAIYALAWIVAFPVLFWALGAVIGVFVYVAAFMIYHRQTRPDVRSSVVALAAAAATAAFVYYTFQDYLGVTLPQGLFA